MFRIVSKHLSILDSLGSHVLATGAFLFKRYTPKLSAYIIAFFLAEIINYCLQLNGDISQFDISFFLGRLVTRPIVSSHWYMYMYIGFLLMLPAFQKLAKSLTESDYMYLFGLYFVLYCVDAVLWFCSNDEMRYYGRNYQGLCTVQNMFIPLMGYYSDKFIKTKKHNVFCLNIAFTLIVFMQCIMVEHTCSIMKDWSKSTAEIWLGYFVAPMSMILFIDIKYFFENINLNYRLEHIITTAGACSFGVYLFEEPLRNVTGIIFNICHKFLPTLISTWVWIFILMILGTLLIWIVKCIPIIKKIL